MQAAADLQIPPRKTNERQKTTLTAETLRHLGIIALCGGAFRVFYQVAFKPCWSGDSHVYSSMFYLWNQHYFSNSYRPPLYALFLGMVQWLAGQRPVPSGMQTASVYLTVYIQSLFGVSAALAVYSCLRCLKVRPRTALAGGLGFALIGAVCQFELLILTEALSLLCISLGIALLLSAWSALQDRSSYLWPVVGSGVFLSLGVLTRPDNLVFLVVLVVLIATIGVRCRFIGALRWASAPAVRVSMLLAASAAPLILLWMSWTYLNIGQFRIAIVTGVTRSESVYNLFSRVEPRDGVAGALLQKSYLYTNRDGRVYRHHVWFALPELMEAAHQGLLPISNQEPLPTDAYALAVRHSVAQSLGLHEHVIVNGRNVFQPVALYDYLGDLSTRLARQNPGAYIQNVADNFSSDTLDFSYPPPPPSETENPHAPEGGSVVRHPAMYEVAVWISRSERPLLLLAYLTVIGFVVYCPILLFRRSESLLRDGLVCALAASMFSVVLAACVIAAYYPEHGVPFSGVMTICAFYAINERKRIFKVPDRAPQKG